jgi:hypothetical protein
MVLVDRQVLETAIEFCEDTWAHKPWLSATIAPGDIDADLNNSVEIDLSALIDNTMIEPIALVSMIVDGSPAAFERLDMPIHYADFSSVATTGRYYYDFTDSMEIRIWPFSLYASATIAMQIAFKPRETATQLDDILFNDWRQGILDGARAEVYDQADAKWYNERKAMKYRTRFTAAKTAAKRLPQGSRVQIPNWL